MKIQNDTHFRTADLRRFFLAGLRAMGAETSKTIEVRRVTRRTRCSRATLGQVVELAEVGGRQDGVPLPETRRWRVREARWIRMLVYLLPDGTVNLRYFARVFEHEVLHSRGVHHKDMNEHQMRCDLPLPAWAEGIEIRQVPARVKVATAVRVATRAEVREAHCRKMLASYEEKQKRGARLLTKWRARVRYYERRAAAKGTK